MLTIEQFASSGHRLLAAVPERSTRNLVELLAFPFRFHHRSSYLTPVHPGWGPAQGFVAT